MIDVVVWVLDFYVWNQVVYVDIGFFGGVLFVKDSWFKRYSFFEVYIVNGVLLLVVICGVYNSVCIVVQQGYFIVFGF